jgi:hypothetical protein
VIAGPGIQTVGMGPLGTAFVGSKKGVAAAAAVTEPKPLTLTKLQPAWFTAPSPDAVKDRVWIVWGTVSEIPPKNINDPIEIYQAGSGLIWIKVTLDSMLAPIESEIQHGTVMPSNPSIFPPVGESGGTHYYHLSLGWVTATADSAGNITSYIYSSGEGSFYHTVYSSGYYCQAETVSAPGGVYGRNSVAFWRNLSGGY